MMILAIGTTPAVARQMIFDGLTLDAVNRAKSVHVSAAGKAVNVARVSRLLGEPVTCIGIAGGDTGRILREDLDHFGVAHRFVESAQPTRVCVTLIDRKSRQTTELVEEAPQSGPYERELVLDAIRQLLPPARAIVCSGTIAPGIGDDFYATIAAIAHSAICELPVIIDAKGDSLRQACRHRVIVKCNVEEMRATFGGSLDEAISACFGEGAKAIIVSNGAKPTLIATPASRWSVESPAIHVVSPIGSGDAMAAGIAVGLTRGLSLAEATILGVAAAADNATHVAAGVIDPDAVQQIKNTLVANHLT
jgi:1-phosphofructokinase family hexose kinase